MSDDYAAFDGKFPPNATKRDAEMERMASALRDLKDFSVKQQGEIERLRAENERLREDFRKTRHIVAERECQRLALTITDLEQKNKNLIQEIGDLNFKSGEVVADNARLREALEKIAKVHGSGDKVVCLHAIDFCAKTSRAALEGM